jgi:hypothetical protein
LIIFFSKDPAVENVRIRRQLALSYRILDRLQEKFFVFFVERSSTKDNHIVPCHL